ncbi:hypothetical protein RD792_008751 [Penstemon davidsonii]|uniref:Uncharacterized protein n=1 Tax=Penstemon davidsonii TaxID=160366 RepID=A0ABR0DBL0_9LAMI|nr:hypothetical protein RD792_008751 [Penstemon davidsonii]
MSGSYGRRGGGRTGDGGRGRGRGRGLGRGGFNAPPPPAADAERLSLELDKKLMIQVASPSPSPSPSHPPRPNFGVIGKKVMVKANHFLVTLADDPELNHYDVSITPEVSSKKVCREIIRQLVTSYRATHLGDQLLAYDGRKSVYTAGPLPFSSKDFVVKLVDDGARREREFKVSIKFASKSDLYRLQQFLQGRQLDLPQETLQILDVVLRDKPSNDYVVVGRSFFSPLLGDKGELGDGLEYWKGFYQSLRPTQMGLSLNIDTSATAFFESISVSDYVAKLLNKDLTRPLSDQDRIKVKRSLRGVRVGVGHQGTIRSYKISGFSTEPTEQLMFSVHESEARISVAQYFLQKYSIRLMYPWLPAVQAGSDTKPIYLPMEMLRSNNYNVKDIVKKFGIEVKPELASIEARVLIAPLLKYDRNELVEPKVGQWNMIDKKMINGAIVDYWTAVNFSRSRIDSNRFCFELINMCNNKGMQFNLDPIIPLRNGNPGHIERTLSDIYSDSSSRLASMNLAGNQLQLLIIILPDVSGSYGKIKRVCETELGIVSQCCQPKQASKFSKQYMENVALKINVKVGGRNTELHRTISGIPFLNDRPTIVFGADVTHPQPGEDSSPSIAAVVASMDWPQVTKYRALVSAQAHREEIIQDLYKTNQDPKRGLVHSGMIREQLIAFYKVNQHRKPDRIIFYRDGVSEGQFNQVLLHEVDAIRKACVSLEEKYLPRITFVVVQKRHHTRLFPAIHGDRYSTDKSGNILPGTVVETKICHPHAFDFYLCSHAGIQGTSRPAHYHVLYDENGFTADAMQMLTYDLCYTYARCTRSVSIVPPAYYAHLAAFRARYYIEGTYFPEDEVDAGGAAAAGRGATRERNDVVRPLPAIKENVKDVMFFC